MSIYKKKSSSMMSDDLQRKSELNVAKREQENEQMSSADHFFRSSTD